MIFCKNDSYIELFIKDPLFKITKNGKIYKWISNQWIELLPKPNENGYRAIRYKYKKILIHRIIYRKFNGKIDSYKSINHKDGNKLNNSYNNLELISNQENQLYNYRSLNRKSKVVFYKINYKIAEKIRKEKKKGKTIKQLCEKYKLSKSTISYIINNKIWNKKLEVSSGKCYPHSSRYLRHKPNWERYDKLKAFYENTPPNKVVDHIIPLVHPDICGLHCIANLQYLTSEENLKKGNKFDKTNDNNSWRI